MNNTRQGVLQKSKLMHLRIIILLLFAFLAHPVAAKTPAIEITEHKKHTQKYHVSFIYSADNVLYSKIFQQISKNLKTENPELSISKVTPKEKIKTLNDTANLIIGIGDEGIKTANKHYLNTKKLFIATDPDKYRLDPENNKNDAILYMAQPFCRQIQFINLVNENWKAIGVLSSQKKPVDSASLQQCADKFNIKIHIENISDDDNLSSKVKSVLKHSDVLLALPDNHIYNSKTVKNILLSSYRLRSPVIAFSKNFVNAGALAAIHSSTEQIAQSASKLIKQFFKSEQKFKKPVNYPQTFEVSINRQVFMALNIAIPDPVQIKQAVKYSEINISVVWQ